MSEQDTRGASDGFRPLPPHPDIEFEKKRAKRLLRDAGAGDADALREMSRVAGDLPAEEMNLQLAQLTVARAYGFSSWVRLLQYYEMIARHAKCPLGHLQEIELHQNAVRRVLDWHKRRIPLGAKIVATFLPRLYGATVEEVFSSDLTEADAQVVVARELKCRDWAEVLARAPKREEARRGNYGSPFGDALKAIREENLGELKRVTAERPELLQPLVWNGGPDSLLRNAVIFEERTRTDAAREIREWLVAQGGDLSGVLNANLGRIGRGPEPVEHWIALGADADWVSPAGVSVLEYALFNYNLGSSNPAAIAALLKHVKRIPEKFWVAAGVGDVNATLSYFDQQGRLTKAARDTRPDFNIIAPSHWVHHPDAPDEDLIFEAMVVAAMNERTEVLEAVISRGYFPVDASPWHSTLLHGAVGWGSFKSCKCLLDLGADPDAPALWNTSPRWLAVEAAKDVVPKSEERSRVAELLSNAPRKA
jgi:hypothetical protein